MGFWLALGFLTVFPVPSWQVTTPEAVGRSQLYFPVVGLLLGLVLAGLAWLLGLILSAFAVDALVLVALIALTGALHLDGLMDTCDGLFGGKIPQERLAIMRDSRVGSFGVVGALSVYLVKYGALLGLNDSLRPFALVLMTTLGAWSMNVGLFAFPYARSSEGLGSPYKAQASLVVLLLATLFTLGTSILVFQIPGILLMLLALAVVILCGAALSRSLGGLTGDGYGAINELVQTTVLIALLPVVRLVEGLSF